MPHHGINHFIKVPPDSTGKAFGTTATSIIQYSSGTNQFVINTIVIGQTSGAEATIIDVRGTVSSGYIYCNLTDDSPVQDFTNGETLLVNGIPFAVVSTNTKEYVQKFNLAGGNNAYNKQFVDDKGAAYIRFSEGEQELDAFGVSKMSSQNLINQYLFYYSDLGSDFTDEIINGTITHLPDHSSIALDIDTNPGDKIVRTSNKYHPYQAGFSQYIMMTISCGDTGKDNVCRRWGYFDGYNGLYFKLDGSDLSVNIRSNASGNVTEQSVSRENWNGDKVDGSLGLLNLSKIDLDVSRINLYWIDFAWLGAGRVRFGIFGTDGSRITLHSFTNPNNFILPYMGKPNLPIRVEIENTGVSASPSRLKLTCCSIISDGNITGTRDKKSYKSTISNSSLKTVSDVDEVPILSFRSSLTFNGMTNRLLSVPELFSLLVKDRPIILKMYKNVVLTGPNFELVPNTAAEIDETATTFSGGTPMITWIFSPGSHNEIFPSNFGVLGESMYLNADGDYGVTYTITAKSLEVGSAQVFYALTFIDIL